TIFSLASGRGRAGVAVLRLSGSGADPALKGLLKGVLPEARRASLRKLFDPRSGVLLDQALVIRFPGPSSFTGEDVVELHLHGGTAVIEAVYGALRKLKGLRPAEAGEFSRRAFESGRLDLTMAEGLNDLVWADTEAQRRQAQNQLGGGLSEKYEDWRDRLTRLLALAEAAIDFSDEDLPEDSEKATVVDLRALQGEIMDHLDDRKVGQRIRGGFQIVLLGAPNVGKSSLLNRLASDDVAIVSELAGTTRDIIEVRMDLAGFAVSLVDTAGLREGGNPVEEEGVRRARSRALEADLKLFIVDATQWPERSVDVTEASGANSWLVINKTDLKRPEPEAGERQGMRSFLLSAKTGEGVQELLAALGEEVVKRLGGVEEAPLTRARHRAALEEAAEALGRVADGRQSERREDPALVSEDIRLALRALGRITGRVGVEDVLDIVFAEFCIGK
ncbi:MAG: tRNA uridine-5-carboxymethylaminomethyl(34) synthesis GTPase MnmE, partial [Sphingomonadales bacterium]